MSTNTLQPVSLVYSKPVKKGFSSKEQNLTQKELEKYNVNKKKKPRVIKGEILEKSIHSYRMWFRFLKLGLELEQQNTTLIMKESARLSGDYTKPTERITKKVRVNRKKYEGWDLDEVLVSTWDNWWKGHRHLFVDEVSKILSPDDVVSSNPNHFTIQFDRRKRLVDAIDDLRNMNREKDLFRPKKRDKFSINGRVRHLVLQNRYNCLVLKLMEELSNEEIIKHKNQYIRPTDKRNVNGYKGGHYGRIVVDLISGTQKSFGAKQILLSVCDGYFVKHPNKNYLD